MAHTRPDRVVSKQGDCLAWLGLRRDLPGERDGRQPSLLPPSYLSFPPCPLSSLSLPPSYHSSTAVDALPSLLLPLPVLMVDEEAMMIMGVVVAIVVIMVMVVIILVYCNSPLNSDGNGRYGSSLVTLGVMEAAEANGVTAV